MHVDHVAHQDIILSLYIETTIRVTCSTIYVIKHESLHFTAQVLTFQYWSDYLRKPTIEWLQQHRICLEISTTNALYSARYFDKSMLIPAPDSCCRSFSARLKPAKACL